jgi:hypothetical protein
MQKTPGLRFPSVFPVWRAQQESNLRTRLRRPVLYPLSYGRSYCFPIIANAATTCNHKNQSGHLSKKADFGLSATAVIILTALNKKPS